MAIKKNEILPFATTWMELEGLMLSEIRERQIYEITHIRPLRYKTDEHKGSKNNIKTGRGTKHKRLLNMENKLRVTGGVVVGRDRLYV